MKCKYMQTPLDSSGIRGRGRGPFGYGSMRTQLAPTPDARAKRLRA